MRRAARVDSNQSAIVEALRRVGATVQTLHTIGQGCPDILVGYRNRNYLLEIKDGRKPPSARHLTPDERVFQAVWMGQIDTVISVDEALESIGAITIT